MTTESTQPTAGRLLGFCAENILKLSAVELSLPPGQTVFTIGGKNGAGKSSILNAIVLALGGADCTPEEPIHGTAEEGKVVLTFEDIVVKVKLVRTDKGFNRYLVVESKDGTKKYGSPQELLNKLTGKLAFDPIAFMNLKPDQQKLALQKLLGLDFTLLDAKRKTAYENRTVENRLLDSANGQLTGRVIHHGVPAEPISVSDLTSALLNAQTENAVRGQKLVELNTLQSTFQGGVLTSQSIQSKIEALRAELAVQESNLASHEKIQKAREAGIALAKRDYDALPVSDTSALLTQLGEVQATNAKIEHNKGTAVLKAKRDEHVAKVKALTGVIEDVDAEKEKLLKAAEFPLEGLSFTDTGVSFNGKPLSQASDAERIAVSTAMGLSLNPTLKLLLIRNGSLLDNDLLQVVSDMASQAGAQVLIERVGDGAECSVIIADGAVKEVRT